MSLFPEIPDNWLDRILMGRSDVTIKDGVFVLRGTTQDGYAYVQLPKGIVRVRVKPYNIKGYWRVVSGGGQLESGE